MISKVFRLSVAFFRDIRFIHLIRFTRDIRGSFLHPQKSDIGVCH
ncbi:MAG: hypothetical protein RLY70_4928 [Planctomycetota bacterium]